MWGKKFQHWKTISFMDYNPGNKNLTPFYVREKTLPLEDYGKKNSYSN